MNISNLKVYRFEIKKIYIYRIVIKAYDEKNELLTNEINILKSLKHNNIVKYIDHSNGNNGIEINTEERYGYFLTNIYIALQYCEVSKIEFSNLIVCY